MMSSGPTAEGRLANEFISARKNRDLVVLEGFHPLKHALRFGATILRVVTFDPAALQSLAQRLAPDVAGAMMELAEQLPESVFRSLAPRPPRTGVLALAHRPAADVAELLVQHRSSPLVLLERPSHLGNVGAVVRVAAGAGAAGVVTTGIHDPWGPDAVRGGAGLQFALPVASLPDGIEHLQRRRGPLLVLDPEGEPLHPASFPSDAIVAFGSERSGLSDEILSEADRRIAIPMEPGVSSLNLATSAAVVLYAWRLASSPK